MADRETSFEVYGYRTSSRFGSRLKVSMEGEIVSVTGPKVPVTIYRLWIAIQLLFLASVLPMLIIAVVLWNWIYLVIALALFIIYYLFSSVGAVALWEYQNALIDRDYQTTSFPLNAVKRIKIGRGWARNWLWLVILPFVAQINKISEGLVVFSFEAPDGETGKDAVYAFLMPNRDKARALAKLLEGK